MSEQIGGDCGCRHCGETQDASKINVTCWACGKSLSAPSPPDATTRDIPIPEALYSCSICREECSWPAESLFWSPKARAWLCSECYDEDEHGTYEISLARLLLDTGVKAGIQYLPCPTCSEPAEVYQ